MAVTRCAWARRELDIRYHDEEWGVPLHDERRLFEFLILEGAQAGLSWSTILNKRAAYRRAYHGFDPRRAAAYGARDIKRLLADVGIVRNRLKIAASIANARAYLAAQEEFGGFAKYLWTFVDGAPIQNAWRTPKQVPAETRESRALSKDLRTRGFRFVGPTICYALMQATGLVNDHTTDCFRYAQLKRR